ncbi:LacI family DNA-binding transcriptional regulator [Umezawaea beigongshangensis]|uniref:LacI family DNA-binding transcriptional regulator n=1 Tax=Umezawaea beigongshangensis TaxID=2780383 RepID=UPI0018F160EC|nr:LacI family DNA-binding transcriptional regulator [Umezawaea beigongshangensis]
MRVKRPTIADIARAAGVSKGAVSYALNDRPGVSRETRERIVELARSLGWAPSSAARALSDGRADAIGLVVDRPARVLGVEPYFMQLISGVQDALDGGTTGLLLQVSDDQDVEMATHRRWWAERRVDGVLLVDLRVADRRVPLVREIGLPAVALGEPGAEGHLPCVWTDDRVAIDEVLEYLAALGHRRVVRIAGPREFVHTGVRSGAFTEAANRLGLTGARVVHADYSDAAAARLTRRLLATATPPTALLFDNDVMAVAALGVADELGLSVPRDLSLVAWDDSALCQLVRPALSAVRRPIAERGAAAVSLLLDLVAGGEPRDVRTGDPVLVTRASTGPAPRSR